MTVHLVQFSTGAGSAEVAFRVHDALDPDDDLVLMTADTMVEDEDNWRFAKECVAQMPRAEWVILRDGRTPMQVGRDQRVVPNNRMAVCSRVLKREILRENIEANYDPDDSIVYLGFDWTEDHRLAAALPNWRPWKIAAPLMDQPYLTKAEILDAMRGRGIEPPSLYAAGFSHANCGGACVRGGQAQWELLLRTNPRRYAEWEAEEETTRQMLGKNVSILKDRRGGTAKPLTLRDFRLRLMANPAKFIADEWGACGCFMDESVKGEEEVAVELRTKPTPTEPSPAPHPAKFSDQIIDEIARYLDSIAFTGTILDPFAGVGRVHALAEGRADRLTFGVELEPEWAGQHPRTITGSVMDLGELGFGPGEMDAIVTSPVYGNRMSDNHTPSETDTSRRNTYKHTLGRDLTEGSAAVLQWGPSERAKERYKQFHRDAWREVVGVLKVEGLFVLNISDHIRGGQRMRVTAWHKATLRGMGIEWVDELKIETPRQRMGANGDARVEYESVLIGVKKDG